jgi:hypothetical protein
LIDLEIANLCFRLLKFIADIYMLFLFLYLLKFIISIRKKGSDDGLTLKNKLVISFILFLWVLTFIQALELFSDSLGDFLQAKNIVSYQDSLMIYLFRIFINLIAPLRDLGIACSFSYLYYSQGRNSSN